MKKLLEYIKPYMGLIFLALIIKLLASMTELVIPSILKKIIDDIVPQGNIKSIYFWGGIMLICAVACFMTNVISNRISATSSGYITRKLRHDVFEKISSFSAEQTDKFTISSLVSRLTSDTYNVNQMLLRLQRIGVRGPILLIGGILITLTMDPVLTLVLLATLPLIAVVVYFVTKISVPIYTYTQSMLDSLVRVVQENITGVRIIKALSKTDYERRRFEKVNTELSDAEQKASIVMQITSPTTTFIMNLGLCFVVLAGAYRVNSGLGKPGTIIAFQSYFTIIMQAMMGITRIFILYSKGAASAERLAEVLDTEEGLKLAESDTIASPYHVEFKNVSFSYNKIENNLTDISFALKKGETLGIIGATGSGKSTVINLLIRFYDPDSGTIRIMGRDIRSIPREELCAKLGIAFQNDFLMQDTIRENIDFGRSLTDEEIADAAENAMAMEFIKALPDGMEHRLTVRGSNLSGGQKQRLLIARALAAKPEILILDDSSSALDYKTDAELRKNLHSNFRDTTTIIVAQRISSIMHAQHILVMDDGRAMAYGTHRELMDTCPVYRQIAESQMGGERYA